MPEASYDPRYLRGIEEFNHRNYFESHEIWEDLWIDHRGPDREFYKGLIQAAVALHHWTRGNRGGALTLWRRSRGYLQPYGARHLGLDLKALLDALARLFEQTNEASLIAEVERDVMLPQLRLDPEDNQP
jgi:predicted metal-dependent hydrolase